MALWRVRATVVDQPGFLAVLAASLALRAVNILSVGVHVTEQGAVDDFLVDAPDELTAEQLLAAVERGRGRDAWVAPAEAHSLVDAPTRALDLATYLVRDPGAVGTALAELLDGQASWQPPGPRLGGQPVEPVEPVAPVDSVAPVEFGVAGGRMRVPAPGGGAWLVERPAPSFTPAEYARAQALLALAAAVAGVGRAGVTGWAAPGPAATLLLPDGRELVVRRAARTDLAAVRAMHGRCSPASLYQRYLSGAGGPSDAQLTRLLEPDRGCALLVESPGAFADRVVAVANLVGEGVQAELALLVEDGWQRRGIGTALLRRGIAVAASTGFDAVVVHSHAQNTAMHRTLRRLDATRRTDREGALVTVTLPLGSAREPCTTGPVG